MASDQIKISTENDKSYGTTTVKPAAKTTEVEVKGIDRLKQLFAKPKLISFLLGWGARHTFSILCFFVYFVNQCFRTNLTVAIVAMVSSKVSSTSNVTSQIGTECPIPDNFNNEVSFLKQNTNMINC